MYKLTVKYNDSRTNTIMQFEENEKEMLKQMIDLLLESPRIEKINYKVVSQD